MADDRPTDHEPQAGTTWAAVDRYLESCLIGDDPGLDDALARSDQAGLPPHAVSPCQGKLLMLLVRLCGARSVCEIGTLGGYSTIWLARGLPPDGRVVTLEIEAERAAVARRNLEAAGMSDRAEIRIGPAAESLARMAGDGEGPFDLFFVDADKRGSPDYFEAAVDLSRPGSVLVFDNVIRGGAIADGNAEDESVRGVRRLHERIAAHPWVDATSIQTVGAKGYDGFTIAIVDG